MEWSKVVAVCASILYMVATYSLNDPDLWVAKITGGRQVAQLIATVYGYQLIDKWYLMNDAYILKKDNSSIERKRAIGKLVKDKRVKWVEQQIPKRRCKRGIYSWLHSRYGRFFNDELWDKEWYIQDYRPEKLNLPVLDLNVVPCYNEGITGKGIRVVVVDDGLEKDHIDLRDNYDPEVSYDFNDNDNDPTPRYDKYGTNSHGTKCAGEIAMTANNHVCGVGIAYEANLGGIRILDGPPSDILESAALGYKMDKVDVFSNSWGPSDDGRAMDAPGMLLADVLYKGVTKGRNGKGIIYIFASGNGKFNGDNCGADGYINSIFTVAIASASQEGKSVHYGERCAAIMATAYSSGSSRNEMIATTNLNNTCTLRHTGTSAAAPLAAGIAALVLQANPKLTWRDFQHLIVWTSEVAALGANPEWTLNGAGYWVSPNFGFGLLNALKLVKMAQQFNTVPKKNTCIMPIKLRGNKTLVKGGEVKVRIYSTGCGGMKSEINFLEHVELVLSVKYPRRGSLSVYLTSPEGTVSTMLEERFKDYATSGLNNWAMTSLHCWGENPRGIWTVSVRAREKEEEQEEDYTDYVGRVTSVLMRLHGTKTMPLHYSNGPRKYEPFYLHKYYLRSPIYD